MTFIEILYNAANAIVGLAFIPQIITLVRATPPRRINRLI